jgi:DnaJ-class molecular chaperone
MVKERLSRADQDQDLDENNDEIDIYKALNCDKTSTTSEIKTQYRKLALQFHPDKQVGKSGEEMEIAAKKFKEITEYYQVLIDPKRRERYEKTGDIGESNLDDFDGSAAGWKEWF